MDEMISRRAAIDIVDGWFKRIGLNGDICLDGLRQLPPATDKNVGTKLGTNLAEVGTDLISRQALLDKFEPWLKVKDYNDGELNMLKAILYEIRFMRSAEPKRGKWIKTARWGRVYYCDQCRNYLDFDGVNAGRGSTNYCPNCGAKMRGEQDG